jgi:2-polyprenyl-3-methyl-5-hydroxy-6-metoxy-1,4-benzoquinol methylase
MAGYVYHARELDKFVAACDAVGGVGHPAAAPLVEAFALTFDTKPDQSLDPFSDEYFAQQVELYKELSGRQLNQQDGEQTPLDVAAHAAGFNPYNNGDVGWIAKHARTIQTCVMLANLPPHATVLDAGCGWGLSSETMAFCGARVTALDINPLFVELVRRRAARLGLPITPVLSEFDKYETDERFDMLLFYECLHHSLKPWETVAHLGRFVKPDGKVVFAGEPINACWWKDWGLRLDPLSVYCIRKFGWWESGWTPDFIARCFAKAGFQLTLFPHVGLENAEIGFAHRHGAAGVVPNTKVCEPVATATRHLEARIAELEARDLHHRHELDQRAAHVAGLRHALADMRASRSWRVTAPMRAVTRRLGVSRG